MSRVDAWYMIQLRAADAKLETSIGCHTFRTTGIRDNLTNGGKLEIAQRMAGHANAKTTGLYDRRNDNISVSEVERVGFKLTWACTARLPKISGSTLGKN
jgi:integrase/recombinase XerD